MSTHTDIDEAITRYEAGGTWEDGDEAVELEVKRPLDKVVPIRLSAEKWELLRREARELGMGPTTFARALLLERLREITTLQPAPSAFMPRHAPRADVEPAVLPLRQRNDKTRGAAAATVIGPTAKRKGENHADVANHPASRTPPRQKGRR